MTHTPNLFSITMKPLLAMGDLTKIIPGPAIDTVWLGRILENVKFILFECQTFLILIHPSSYWFKSKYLSVWNRAGLAGSLVTYSMDYIQIVVIFYHDKKWINRFVCTCWCMMFNLAEQGFIRWFSVTHLISWFLLLSDSLKVSTVKTWVHQWLTLC